MFKTLFFCLLFALFGSFCFCNKSVLENELTAALSPTTSDCNECGPDEEYSECGYNGCQNTCAEPYLSYICKGACTPGCICKDGYLLDDNFNCIPKQKCPNSTIDGTCCSNEVANHCPTWCSHDLTCQEVMFGIGRPCPPAPSEYECIPKCFCKPGLVRINGECESPSECCTDPNAEYVKCPNPCSGGTCEQPKFTPCKRKCFPFGCQCKEGFVRGPNNKCIPVKECKSSDPNAEIVKCPNPCPGGTCESIEYKSCNSTCPAWGWQCKTGFVKDTKRNKCIPISECKCSDPNAEWVKCPNPCPGGNCDRPDFSPCRMMCPAWGCQCKKGYVQNALNICIPIDLCKKCSPNEAWHPCPQYCSAKTCEMLFDNSVCLKKPSLLPCKPKCVCRPGYAVINGTCQSSKKCCVLKNEEFVKCPNPCPGGTCDNPKFQPCKALCKPFGCQCKSGYVRNEKGNCVLLSECGGIKCNVNEVWDPCTGNCKRDNTCPVYLGELFPAPCPPQQLPIPCIGKCFCLPGLIRIDGNCTLPEKCCADPNSELVECPNPCPGGTCDQLQFQNCSLPCKSRGCQCKKGFVKDSTGKCVILSQCPKKCKENEVLEPCPSRCRGDINCPIYFGELFPSPCFPDPTPGPCVEKCFCSPGYIRVNGTCLLPEKCCSDPNSEMVQCPNPCPGGTCEQPEFQNCSLRCKTRGCQCKEGYYKDSSGKCILSSECPNKCKNNEIWDPCPSRCKGDLNCPIYFGEVFPAPCRPDPTTGPCVGKCFCSLGYIRVNGSCSLPEQCCADPNSEIVSCPNPCPGGTCEQPEFQPCDRRCFSRGCQCKTGYLKNDVGKCVPKSSCHKCRQNEYWDPCPHFCSFDMSCELYLSGLSVPPCSLPPVTPSCVGRCRCEPGYVMLNGDCVKPEQCCTDLNSELVGCPNHCPGGTCEQPDFANCSLPCRSFGCQCKRGYVRNVLDKCITIDDCIARCGLNEVWDPCPGLCANDISCPIYLEELFPAPCFPDQFTPHPCKGKCRCNPGYLRINGTCLLPEQCCDDPNAELVRCPNPCEGGTCKKPEFDSCSLHCKTFGCQCKSGYVKNDQEICVPLPECNKPGQVCGENEVWNICPAYCRFETFCDMLLLDISPLCNTQPPAWRCSPKCECKQGFVRLRGKCQPPSACCSDPNSSLEKCPNPCPGGTCSQPTHTECNLVCKQWGCVCNKGYVNDANGFCVPLTSCNFTSSIQCGENERINLCPNECSPETNCDEFVYGVIPKVCDKLSTPAVCVPKCECIDSHARNRDGMCVLINDCCIDSHSEVVANPVCCPGRSCCPGHSCTNPQKVECDSKCPVRGCQCKQGYLRMADTNNVCIPWDKCALINNTTTPT